jgi:trk system potassium uptake protein TrkH
VNFGAISRVLAGFVAFFTLVQLVPLALALVEAPGQRGSAVAGFTGSVVIGSVVALLLAWGGRGASPGFYRRETLCVAGFSWVVASVLAAIPFQWSGVLPDATDALFESVSGLTTCGGTVFGSAGNPRVEGTQQSLLLWRALTQWLGGIGIVLIFVALLPSGAVSKSLMLAESVGVGNEGYQPRVLHQARWVIAIYVVLTGACTGLLVVTGLSWFDAVCQAFSTLATGGFSTRTSIAEFQSLPAEIVLTVFMFLGGCSFTVMAGVLRDGWHGLRAMVRMGEFRMYTLFTAATILVVAIDLVRGGKAWEDALRESSFNVVSMLTCTGFATADFHAWPPLSLLVIFTCTIVGGCSGSAAGGLKQVRLLVCLRLFAFTLRSFVQPKRVDRLRLDGEVLPASTVSTMLAIVLMWLTVVLLGACIVALDQRLGFLGALSASSSMLGNCGPALAIVDGDMLARGLPALGQAVPVVGPNIGPFGGYGELAGWTKLVLSFEMVLGRLELLTLLAMLSPGFWRR